MSVLNRFWNRWRENRLPRPARRSVTDGRHWHVHDVAEFSRLFEALPYFAPRGSILGLADGAWPPALQRFLNSHAVDLGNTLLQTLPSDFAQARYIPVDSRVMTDLARLANHCAEPEVALHLVVVHDGVPWLEWYDATDDPIALAWTVDEPMVARFAEQVGGRYEEARH
jgi:hypothetical protein